MGIANRAVFRFRQQRTCGSSRHAEIRSEDRSNAIHGHIRATLRVAPISIPIWTWPHGTGVARQTEPVPHPAGRHEQSSGPLGPADRADPVTGHRRELNGKSVEEWAILTVLAQSED